MTEIDEAIELSEYQATWPRVFAEEQARICQLLDIPGEDLEHTGSTAVPGSSYSVGRRWARQAYRVGCTFGCEARVRRTYTLYSRAVRTGSTTTPFETTCERTRTPGNAMPMPNTGQSTTVPAPCCATRLRRLTAFIHCSKRH
jgi:hypothetical protein